MAKATNFSAAEADAVQFAARQPSALVFRKPDAIDMLAGEGARSIAEGHYANASLCTNGGLK